ncbi:Metallo-hydrolase/oxidoreductase [Linderina pennispora]|uniref:Metallo-hydrolase/oxidoreductase n=1 Tax=Linderina pennispora TaxID=61395 RepID=A0A1Y1WGJ0_9FUNG|nr:Metallo-hydrolase/oxidoreductase [Linderina pennispora]ORX72607.1 Metallo-hydrolase/oxidoreductase [Linderina pennispora]
MSRAFGIGLGWLRVNRSSTSVCCIGAIAGYTVYCLIADQWISSRRSIMIEKRKQQDQLIDTKDTRNPPPLYASLFIGVPAGCAPWSRIPAYAEYPDVSSLNRDSQITATWLGQSTCFVQMEGLNILTDPIFKRRTVFSWLGPERLRPVPCQLKDLPHPDIVLVSHNHFDHLDIDVVKSLGNSVTWYVPLGLRDWFARQGIYKVKELDWWHESDITHWSGRNGFDSNCSLWSSFLVKAFKEVGKRYGPVTLAALPIGSYEPRWYMCHQHVNPDDAVKIHRDLGAKWSIGVHWGTFMMSDEHYLAPVRDLKTAC